MYAEGDGGELTVLPYNPWFNTNAPHNFTWFYDWNHGSSKTRDFVKRNLKFWVDEFHIDGFRWDFTQGIVQEQGVNGAYNEERINWLKEYGDHVWNTDPDVYMILEHWCDPTEERELADYNGANGNAAGFMLWANATVSYQEASMGYSSNDLSWANFEEHNYQDRHAVAYAESHDEERLMYKNLQFGNSSGTYDTSDPTTALRRQQLTMAFNLLMPGPRMIWQFEELGYDYSIHTCLNGSVNPDDDLCKLSPKPVRWDYFEDPERQRLYQVTGALGRLKRDYAAFGTAATSFNVDVGGFGKRMHFEHPNGDAIVVGNFKTTTIDMIPGFTHMGTWYDYLEGDSIDVTNPNEPMVFEPGEFHIYTDIKLNSPFETASEDDPDGTNDLVQDEQVWINCYPNPTADVLHVEFDIKREPTRIGVMDMQGRKLDVISTPNRLGQWTVDMTPLESGTYLLTWHLNGQAFSTPVYKITP